MKGLVAALPRPHRQAPLKLFTGWVVSFRKGVHVPTHPQSSHVKIDDIRNIGIIAHVDAVCEEAAMI
jgi:hypothetical protein